MYACSLLLGFYSCAWYYTEIGACWRGSMARPTPPSAHGPSVQSSGDAVAEGESSDQEDDLDDRAPLLGGEA